MFLRRAENVAFEHLGRADAVTPEGPTQTAAAVVRRLGMVHGKQQKRVVGPYEIHCRLAQLTLDRAFAVHQEERAGLEAARMKAERRLAELDRVLADTSDPGTAEPEVRFGDAKKMAAVNALRRKAERAALAGQREATADHLKELEARLGAGTEKVRNDLRSLADAVNMLWSIYQTAYIESLSGPADSQRQGAFEELTFTMPDVDSSDRAQSQAIQGVSDDQ